MIGKSSSVRSIFQYVFDEASNSFWCWTHWTVLFHFWLEIAKNWSFIEKSGGTLGDFYRNANKETDRLKFRCTLSNFMTIRVIKLFKTRKSVALYCKNESFANYHRTIVIFLNLQFDSKSLDASISELLSWESSLGAIFLFIKRFSNYRVQTSATSKTILKVRKWKEIWGTTLMT